jgi:hypothetical protein
VQRRRRPRPTIHRTHREGLAFDWVAGYKEKWEPDPKLKRVKGNPAERMLESCATVEEEQMEQKTKATQSTEGEVNLASVTR